jgi:glutamate carboxypeptidase
MSGENQIGALTAYLETRLAAYLDELRILAGMDSYSTDKDDVNRVNDWLAARLSTLGFDVERYAHPSAGDDLLAWRRGNGSGRILLLGHSDTVFPHGTAAARPMTIDGDKVLGPGTCDMKAGLLSGLYAVEALDAIGWDAYERIGYLCVSDEEVDRRHAVPLIRAASREADAVLTLEAARENGDIVTARKGAVWFAAEAHGKAAHAGVEPEKGCSAILALAHQVIALDKLNDPARGITVNCGMIEGGRQANIVADHARLVIDLRAFSQEELDSITSEVLSLFRREVVPGVTFDVMYEEKSPPMPRTPAIEALEKLAQQAASELGLDVKGASTGGAADAAYAAAEGIPALDGLGPVGGLDHGPDEYIRKSSIVPRTALLARLMMLIAQQEASR